MWVWPLFIGFITAAALRSSTRFKLAGNNIQMYVYKMRKWKFQSLALLKKFCGPFLGPGKIVSPGLQSQLKLRSLVFQAEIARQLLQSFDDRNLIDR